MKVILQREVDKLGAPGDVVEVKDGYARNFLIPRGLAAPATKGGMRHADRLRSAHHTRVQKAVTEARAVADRLGGTPLRIPARAGEDGRLFGSVTAADVADALTAAGAAVDRRHVHLDEPIRSVGTHDVAVHLHPEVDATVTVEVVPQQS
jgi:large subunit ribosomal protein L9